MQRKQQKAGMHEADPSWHSHGSKPTEKKEKYRHRLHQVQPRHCKEVRVQPGDPLR